MDKIIILISFLKLILFYKSCIKSFKRLLVDVNVLIYNYYNIYVLNNYFFKYL